MQALAGWFHHPATPSALHLLSNPLQTVHPIMPSGWLGSIGQVQLQRVDPCHIEQLFQTGEGLGVVDRARGEACIGIVAAPSRSPQGGDKEGTGIRGLETPPRSPSPSPALLKLLGVGGRESLLVRGDGRDDGKVGGVTTTSTGHTLAGKWERVKVKVKTVSMHGMPNHKYTHDATLLPYMYTHVDYTQSTVYTL